MTTNLFTRRALLRAISGGGLAIAGAGCIIPSHAPPSIAEPKRPMGSIPRRARDAERGLLVGAASIEITPPARARTFLAGYGFNRRRREVRDPIYARTLFFDDGTHRTALIVADVVGTLFPTTRRVRKLVGNGIDVAVASTHNHQSPDTMGYWGKAILYAVPYSSGLDVSYQRVFEKRLAASVAMAAASAKPASLSFARAEIPAGVVRNLRNPGVYDRAVEVFEARAKEDGTPIASFVNFGCHPETLGDRSHKMSADFPGRLRERVDSELGGTTVFANGILGGMITSDLDDSLDARGRSQAIDRIGDVMGGVALEALKTATPASVETVRYRRKEIELPSTNELFAYVERVGLVESRKRGANGGLTTEVGRIDLGQDIGSRLDKAEPPVDASRSRLASLALVPGEPSPMVGLRIKERLGVEHPALIALANDELGYILDPAQFDDPAFSYEVTVSVGRQTGPIIEAALAELR